MLSKTGFSLKYLWEAVDEPLQHASYGHASLTFLNYFMNYFMSDGDNVVVNPILSSSLWLRLASGEKGE